jgi:hypothetical protein
MCDELDQQYDESEWLVSNVLFKTGCLSLEQWYDVAATYELLDDDERQEITPNLSKLNAKDMDYLVKQYERHQWDLTEQDLKRSYVESQVRRMRLHDLSLK